MTEMIMIVVRIIIWSIVVPFLLGQLVYMLGRDSEEVSAVSKKLAYGFMLMCVIFFVFAVPMITLRLHFHVLVYSWVFITVVLCILSVIYGLRNAKVKQDEASAVQEEKKVKAGADVFTVMVWTAAVLMIAFQTYLLTFNMHVDTDDARFVAEAVEAVDYDTMLIRHAITNEYIGRVAGEQTKEVTAPYPLFIALMSKLYGIHPAICAHTVFPALFIPLCYVVFGIIGAHVFEGDMLKRGLFLLFLSVIHLFSFETIYASGYTLLTIIWQGRSILAMIMLPLLWYFLMRVSDSERVRREDYVYILMAAVACAMLSNMGAVLAGVMTAVYAVVNGVRLRSFKTCVFMGLCMVPDVVCVLITRLLRLYFERM